ncbi:MAG: TRAP transporter large permease subunit, partial [Brooklawnia sp.]|nr:TRAP transporter large permease subunit [Brooklawnia sp.]
RKRPELKGKGFPKLGEFLRSLWGALPSLGLIVVVIIGIVGIPGLFSAFFTPTEGAAVAVLYALILSFIYRTIRVKDLPRILLSATRTSSVVIFLIGLSSIMSFAMTFSGIPELIGNWLIEFTDSPVVFLLIMMVILLIIGIPLDATPAVLIFTPIFLPIAVQYGIHPVHLGMMMIFNMCIAVISPPSAPVLFVGARVAGKKVEEVIKPLMPFFGALILMLLVIQYVPELSLALPRAAGLIYGA